MNKDRIFELCETNRELFAPFATHAHRFNVLLSTMLAVKLDAYDDYVFWLRKLTEIGETIESLGEDMISFGEFQADIFELIHELVKETENEP